MVNIEQWLWYKRKKKTLQDMMLENNQLWGGNGRLLCVTPSSHAVTDYSPTTAWSVVFSSLLDIVDVFMALLFISQIMIILELYILHILFIIANKCYNNECEGKL